MIEEENITEEKRKNKYTLFLERNEIWFKTVLSLAVTCAALLVSFASYKTAEYQAKLSATVAASQDKEKQPFFRLSRNTMKIGNSTFMGLLIQADRLDIAVFRYSHICTYISRKIKRKFYLRWMKLKI